MKNNVKRYLEKLKENKKLHVKRHLLMLACGFFVIAGVFGALLLPGFGQESEPGCGMEEHTHTADCGIAYTCGGETTHVHTADCGIVYTCGETTHLHTADCGIVYTCGGDETHEHTAECSFEYACGLEENVHEHTAECSFEYACGLEENVHEHTEECSFVYLCGKEEHVHSDACYLSVVDDATDTDDTVNESLVIGFTPSQHTASSGTSISIKVISNYSKANHESEKVTSVIKIGKLPEGIT